MEIAKFSRVCRCCLETGDIALPDDNLPKNICQPCFDKLSTCYVFLIKYHRLQESITKNADFQGIKKGSNTTTNQNVDIPVPPLDSTSENNIEHIQHNSEDDSDFNKFSEGECDKNSENNDDDQPSSRLKQLISKNSSAIDKSQVNNLDKLKKK
ncbi:hypothetical protein HHI36_007367 [Cryptolaemus montrouzieri]|uniref:ZAD domain-containing protein n=1 Tax=Cryptolaemus montrouzieri TaxID=559131 RepID=A0ABD2MPF6_9CUCU